MAEFTNGGRERAYQALRESEELHRATLSHISDAVFLTNDDRIPDLPGLRVLLLDNYLPKRS